MAARIARGDVRLYEFASPNKRRPVVVLTRDSAIGCLSTVTASALLMESSSSSAEKHRAARSGRFFVCDGGGNG